MAFPLRDIAKNPERKGFPAGWVVVDFAKKPVPVQSF